MNIRPTRTCCGCLSLLVGMEVICLMTLIMCIFIISICSSSQVIKISTIDVAPWIQVTLGAWAFFGIPIAITAGVAALYRIEIPIRVFFFYIVTSFLCNLVPIWMLMSGSICDSIISREVQQLGSSFVCTFTDSFVFCWLLIGSVIHAYIAYVVWSAAEEIAEAPFPELMRYSNALKGIFMPNPMGAMPMGPRAVGMGAPTGPMMPMSFGGPAPMPGIGHMPTGPIPRTNNGPPMNPGYASMATSEPGMMQSFMPVPSSGVFK